MLCSYLHTSQGRVLKADNEWKYEYHHHDHLGNLRAAIRKRRYIDEYIGTMEDSSEIADFDNGAAVWAKERTRIYSWWHRLNGDYAFRLNPDDTLELGLCKVLNVNEGEEIDVSVDYYIDWIYLDEEQELPAEISSSDGGEHPEVENIRVSNFAVLFGFPVRYVDAYLMVLYEDSAGNYMESESEAYLIDDFSNEQAHLLSTVPAGAVRAWVYVANEAERDIYFDDFTIQHIKPFLLVQENHYYPFGMSMKGLEKEVIPITVSNLTVKNGHLLLG